MGMTIKMLRKRMLDEYGLKRHRNYSVGLTDKGVMISAHTSKGTVIDFEAANWDDAFTKFKTWYEENT